MNKFKLNYKFVSKSGIVFQVTVVTNACFYAKVISNPKSESTVIIYERDLYSYKEFVINSGWSFMFNGQFERTYYNEPCGMDFAAEYKPIKTILPLP